MIPFDKLCQDVLSFGKYVRENINSFDNITLVGLSLWEKQEAALIKEDASNRTITTSRLAFFSGFYQGLAYYSFHSHKPEKLPYV